MEQKTESSLKDGIQNVPLNTFCDVRGRVLLIKTSKRGLVSYLKMSTPLVKLKFLIASWDSMGSNGISAKSETYLDWLTGVFDVA